MTEQEAKRIALFILHHYKTLPFEKRIKSSLPKYLYDEVITFQNNCPLCELFCYVGEKIGRHCDGCPLFYPSCNNFSDEFLENNIKLIKEWGCKNETGIKR
jgi:hypothetical protein